MRRFVDYLQLLQPLEGETTEEIDVRIEVETEDDPEPGIDVSPGRSATSSPSDADPPEPVDPAEAEREAGLEETARRLVIPEDPTVLSYLLSGIIQVDAVQRQLLLEMDTTEDRLDGLAALIDRELWLLRRRLRHFVPDTRYAAVRRN
jgi:hypothetical protein